MSLDLGQGQTFLKLCKLFRKQKLVLPIVKCCFLRNSYCNKEGDLHRKTDNGFKFVITQMFQINGPAVQCTVPMQERTHTELSS